MIIRDHDEVHLQQGRRGQHEQDVVDGRRELRPVRALAGPVKDARVRAEPRGEEEAPVDVPRLGGLVFRSREAAELRGFDLRQGRRGGRLFCAGVKEPKGLGSS